MIGEIHDWPNSKAQMILALMKIIESDSCFITEKYLSPGDLKGIKSLKGLAAEKLAELLKSLG